jgi:hypothetical protein
MFSGTLLACVIMAIENDAVGTEVKKVSKRDDDIAVLAGSGHERFGGDRRMRK